MQLRANKLARMRSMQTKSFKNAEKGWNLILCLSCSGLVVEYNTRDHQGRALRSCTTHMINII